MMSASLPANTGAAPKRPTPINRVAKILFMVAFLSSGFSSASVPFDRRDLGRKDAILLCDSSQPTLIRRSSGTGPAWRAFWRHQEATAPWQGCPDGTEDKRRDTTGWPGHSQW